MAISWRLRLLAARVRRRSAGSPPDREQVVRRHAAGKSFCDVGCMWKAHGRIAFVAEEAGATRVTGLDVAAPSAEFKRERDRRGSAVRFVRGDLHETATVAEVGRHEVIWCSGVLYHSPYPVLALERLRELATELLILQTATLPELPGVAQGLVFYPHLPARDRDRYGLWGAQARRGLVEPRHADRFGPWWWGISPSALEAMLRAARFEPLKQWGDPLGRHVIARAA